VTTGALVIASNSTAVLTGKIVSNGSQTSYWYEYGKTNGLGSRTNTQNIGSGYVSLSAPGFLTGLSADTTYFFRLVATNSFGTVTGNTISFMTNSNPPVAGNVPTLRTDAATAVDRTAANLNGRVDPNNAETSYWFEYGDSINLGNTTALQSAGAGDVSISKSTTVDKLAPGTKYYFRLNAQNQFGTVNGTMLTFTTSGTPMAKAPVMDTTAATAVASTKVTLNGVVNPNGDATTYWFEYSDDSLLSHLIGTTTRTALAGSGTTPTNVSATLTGLNPNATYSFRLVAANAFGMGGGDIVTFKTRPK